MFNTRFLGRIVFRPRLRSRGGGFRIIFRELPRPPQSFKCTYAAEARFGASLCQVKDLLKGQFSCLEKITINNSDCNIYLILILLSDKLTRKRRSNSIYITVTTLWPRCSSMSYFTRKCKKSQFIQLHLVNFKHFSFSQYLFNKRVYAKKAYSISMLCTFYFSLTWSRALVVFIKSDLFTKLVCHFLRDF